MTETDVAQRLIENNLEYQEASMTNALAIRREPPPGICSGTLCASIRGWWLNPGILYSIQKGGARMGFTVREAIDLGYFDKCSLLAGRAGLDRRIEAVSVLEVPDACSWIRGGELAVTALFGVRDSPEQQVELVEGFARSGGSGLVVFLLDGRYLESLSPDLVGTAERLGLPLFQARDLNMAYADLIMPIMEELTLRRFSEDLAETAYGTGSIGEFGTCEPVAGALSERLGNTVVLLSPEFERVEQYVPAGDQEVSDTLIEQCRQKYESQDYDCVSTGIAKIEVPSQPAAVLLCQVKDSHRRLTGYLLIAGNPKGILSKGKLTFISIALGLYEVLHTQRERADRMQARYQSDFVTDLLAGKLASLDVIMERAKLLGLDMQDRSYVIVAVGEDASEKHSIVECVFQALRTVDPNTLCLARHSRVVALPKCREGDPSRSREEFVKNLVGLIEGDLSERIVIGVGSYQASLERLNCSYHDACEAVRLYLALPPTLRDRDNTATVAYYERLGHLTLFEQLVGDPANRSFAKHVLEPITDYDSRYGSELLDTMLAYVWEGLDRARAARRLFIHRNTLSYRLQRIRSLLGEDPFSDGNLPRYFTALGIALFEPERRDSVRLPVHPA